MTKARSNAVAEAAKGDLSVGSGTNLASILAVGSNGDTLVADSSTSTGLRYQVPVQDNPVLNSAFQVAQRGTSVAVAAGLNAYTLDRWMYGAGGVGSASTISQQSTNDTTNLPFIRSCVRVQRNSGQTGTTPNSFSQSIESSNSAPFIGKTVTFSFYARAGANYSPTGNNFIGRVYTGTSVDGNVQIGPWSGIALPIEVNVSLTTTWQRFQGTGTISSTANQLAAYFINTPTGTAGANDYVEITGVQIEVGSVATPFHTNGATIQGELAACQRYYYRMTADQLYSTFAFGFANLTTSSKQTVSLPSTLRVIPSSVDFSTLVLSDTNANYTISSLTLDANNASRFQPTLSVASTGLTQYRPLILTANNSTSAYLGFSAEL